MKRILFKCVLMLVAAGMVSCGDLLESSGNGKLDGMWHLVGVDTLATGGHHGMAESRKFLSVQGRILEMRDADVGAVYMFRFTRQGNQLSLSDARYNDRMHGDPKVENASELRPFGVNSLEEAFVIEQLSGSKMTLVSSMLRLMYRKY